MKFVKITALVLAAALVFAGCSKNGKKAARKPSSNIDSTTWIDNLIDGKAAAQKENKKIFLFFSGEDQDGVSRDFKDNVFDTPAFKDAMTEKYVLVNMDFSNRLFDEAQAAPEASDEEKKAAAALMTKLEENMRDASVYNIQALPAFFILTKEGYVVTEVIFPAKLNELEDFTNVMDGLAEKIAVYENTLTSAREGKAEDRLNAINKLFELTEPQLRFLLQDLAASYVKLDKKNATGMVGTYVVSIANANAFQAYLDQDPLTASEQFANAAKNKFLKPEEKQQCFYTAAYLYTQSGSEDHKVVIDYLQKAYDAAPESREAESIKSMMRMMEERFGEAVQAAAETPDAPASDEAAPEAPAAESKE